MTPNDQAHSHLHPVRFAQNLWVYRELILRLSAREVKGRYKGASLGLIWPFISALVMLAIYTVVFGLIFKARWPEARTNSIGETALILFCGLIVFEIFRECLARSPSLVRNNTSLIKRMVFPAEVLPVSVLGNALFHGVISIGILLVASVIMLRQVSVTVLWLPVVFIPLVLYTLGASWFAAALGVYFPDLQEIMGLALRAFFFMSPIVYSSQMIPENLRWLVQLNPLFWVISDVRAVLLWAGQPNLTALAVGICGGFVFMVLGYAFFMVNKPVFPDVL